MSQLKNKVIKVCPDHRIELWNLRLNSNQGFCSECNGFRSISNPTNKELESIQDIHLNSDWKRYFNSYQTGADCRKHIWDLTYEFFLLVINRNCYYCGAKPRLLKSYNNIIANGVDRFDNKIGYIKSNVVTCCTKCNLMKGKFSNNEFVSHIENIYFHQLSLNISIKGG